jgi:hypothetical protein
VQARASSPLQGNEHFQVFALGSEPSTATGVGLNAGCQLFESGTGVDLDPDPWASFDLSSANPLAVSASWDASPHPHEELPPSDAYLGVADQLLEARNLEDDDPDFPQLVRTDLDGDGVFEVLGVIERNSSGGESLIPAEPGDYSIAFVRTVEGDEARTHVLFEWVVVGDGGGDEFIQDLVIGRFDALADLDGDGVDEIALRTTYYEGSGVTIHDWDGDAFPDRISVGCGA